MTEALDVKDAENPLINPDLAPVHPRDRTWRVGSYAALWISMAACIPTYQLASGLVAGGMNWWQAILTIFLGNVIVLFPMLLNAHAGTRYGIPFPVFCRASFGTRGANLPAIMRALVACGWFGIQCWIGGEAIYILLKLWKPEYGSAPAIGWLGINQWQLLCFLVFWGINMLVVFLGIKSIRVLLNIKAPLLIILGLALLFWAHSAAGGFGPMLSKPSAFDAGHPKAGGFWPFFWPALTGMVGFWATLSLNIPDFSRYAVSQRDQALGQTLGLPLTMALFAFIGVAVTSATTVIYEQEIWDPVQVLEKFKNEWVLVGAMLSLVLATLATNIAANVVSPANDFAHLAPRHISFRIGGLITGLIGIAIMPWKLMADANRYIGWLVSYSALLGPIAGIMIADYFVYRRRDLDLAGLYHQNGPYRYCGGFSIVAIVAFVGGVLPSLPGFLVKVGAMTAESVSPERRATFEYLVGLFDYAWFVGFAVSFILYLLFRPILRRV